MDSNGTPVNKFQTIVWIRSQFKMPTRESLKGSHTKSRTRRRRRRAPRQKLGLSRRKFQLKGGQRVTNSVEIKRNRIVFDHQKGEIVDRRKLLNSLLLLGQRKKIMAKIEDVEEIKSGMQTANFIELKRMIDAGKMDPLEEHLCLSIVFKNNIRTIDLIAPNETVQRKWQRTLQTLIETSSQYREIKQDFDQFLLQRFQQSDRDRNGVITFDEALSMLSKLNILFDEHEVKMLFEKANFRKPSNSQMADGLDTEEFMEFYHLISHTKCLNDEFACITKGRGMLNVKRFQKFLLNRQKMDLAEVERVSKALLAKYEPLEANRENVARLGHVLSCKGFRNLVNSPEFDIAHKYMEGVHQDMNRPLTDYFIATSHNTYLNENQLEGRSTTETYRIYLSQGCRSVELDIQDGNESTDYEPVVFHKLTLTSRMSLREIADTIAEYAFKTSPFPVIISLENNCKELLSQRRAAEIFRTSFGRHLITGPLFGGKETTLPSPLQLREKIIIKGKRLPLTEGCNVAVIEMEHCLAKELSDLVWYGASKRFVDFGTNYKYNQMASIEEAKSEKFSRRQISAYRDFTSSNLVKVYPHGLRFFSGNYDPLPHWRSGAQMISLNYQTGGSPMQLNRALFETNGSCGYVLKPPHLRRPMKSQEEGVCHLTIRVLCAFNLPVVDKSIVDPFVEIRLFGADKGATNWNRRRLTKVIRNNGLNPQWNREFTFDIDCADLPLVFVRFQIKDQNIFAPDKLIGQRMIAFECISEGYRNIRLLDSKGKLIDHARLVVEIVKDWWTADSEANSSSESTQL